MLRRGGGGEAGCSGGCYGCRWGGCMGWRLGMANGVLSLRNWRIGGRTILRSGRGVAGLGVGWWRTELVEEGRRSWCRCCGSLGSRSWRCDLMYGWAFVPTVMRGSLFVETTSGVWKWAVSSVASLRAWRLRLVCGAQRLAILAAVPSDMDSRPHLHDWDLGLAIAWAKPAWLLPLLPLLPSELLG